MGKALTDRALRFLDVIPGCWHFNTSRPFTISGHTYEGISGLGVFVVDFTPELPSVFPDVRFASGIVVVALSPGPDTQSRSIHADDIIHALNNASVKSVEQLRSALHRPKPDDPVVLQIERRGKLRYVAFDME